MSMEKAVMKEKLKNYFSWVLENHPGKLIGSLVGFLAALAFILLGFWQTIFLLAFTSAGFYLGKCWDEGQLPPRLANLVHRIRFWRKK